MKSHWSGGLIIVGGIAMLIGGIDPMEGSLAILPGSALVALGMFLRGDPRRLVTFRVGVFLAIALGVGAHWGFSSVGGLGGDTGRSMWWGLLILPYMLGWSASIWGPGSPRWMLRAGVAVGLWYLALLAIVLRGGDRLRDDLSKAPIMAVAAIGLLTIAGCVWGLTHPPAKLKQAS